MENIRYPEGGPHQKYKIGKQLGSGASGQVFVGHRISEPVAIKIVPQGGTNDLAARREAYALGHLSATTPVYTLNNNTEEMDMAPLPGCHPGVVCLKDYFFAPKYGIKGEGAYVLVLQNVDGWDLFDALNRYGALPQDALLHLTWSLLDTLEYIHGRGVIHNDIKAENVMLDRTTGTPVFLDFGFACTLGEGEEGCAFGGGTPEYAAQEVLQSMRYPATDMWALGVLIWEMAMGEAYTAFSMEETAYNLFPKARGQPELLDQLSPLQREYLRRQFQRDTLTAIQGGAHPNVSRVQDPVIRELLSHIFKVNPRERITATQAKHFMEQQTQKTPVELKDLGLRNLIQLEQEATQLERQLRRQEQKEQIPPRQPPRTPPPTRKQKRKVVQEELPPWSPTQLE